MNTLLAFAIWAIVFIPLIVANLSDRPGNAP